MLSKLNYQIAKYRNLVLHLNRQLHKDIVEYLSSIDQEHPDLKNHLYELMISEALKYEHLRLLQDNDLITFYKCNLCAELKEILREIIT